MLDPRDGEVDTPTIAHLLCPSSPPEPSFSPVPPAAGISLDLWLLLFFHITALAPHQLYSSGTASMRISERILDLQTSLPLCVHGAAGRHCL